MTGPVFQDAGLLSLITEPIHTPVTLFWPSDQALQALPREQQDFLFNQGNQDKLKEYLKFHVIRDAKVFCFHADMSVGQPREGCDPAIVSSPCPTVSSDWSLLALRFSTPRPVAPSCLLFSNFHRYPTAAFLSCTADQLFASIIHVVRWLRTAVPKSLQMTLSLLILKFLETKD